MNAQMPIPLLLEPAELEPLLTMDNIVIVDLCKQETYNKSHIPGAKYCNYNDIVRHAIPVRGLLPESAEISKVMQALGISADSHVIAYDDEGGGNASRLVWTLHACGHYKTSVLNGGIISWANEGHRQEAVVGKLEKTDYELTIVGLNVIEADEIIEKLDSDDFTILDARSVEEYKGEKVYAARGGRVPGAKHFEWTDAMDKSRNLRLKPDSVLREMLIRKGLTPDKEIAVYCQAHHRSALSYFMLKHLGYHRVRGYHGAWSDWGNRQYTPIETG